MEEEYYLTFEKRQYGTYYWCPELKQRLSAARVKKMRLMRRQSKRATTLIRVAAPIPPRVIPISPVPLSLAAAPQLLAETLDGDLGLLEQELMMEFSSRHEERHDKKYRGAARFM